MTEICQSFKHETILNFILCLTNFIFIHGFCETCESHSVIGFVSACSSDFGYLLFTRTPNVRKKGRQWRVFSSFLLLQSFSLFSQNLQTKNFRNFSPVCTWSCFESKIISSIIRIIVSILRIYLVFIYDNFLMSNPFESPWDRYFDLCCFTTLSTLIWSIYIFFRYNS